MDEPLGWLLKASMTRRKNGSKNSRSKMTYFTHACGEDRVNIRSITTERVHIDIIMLPTYPIPVTN